MRRSAHYILVATLTFIIGVGGYTSPALAAGRTFQIPLIFYCNHVWNEAQAFPIRVGAVLGTCTKTTIDTSKATKACIDAVKNIPQSPPSKDFIDGMEEVTITVITCLVKGAGTITITRENHVVSLDKVCKWGYPNSQLLPKQSVCLNNT